MQGRGDRGVHEHKSCEFEFSLTDLGRGAGHAHLSNTRQLPSTTGRLVIPRYSAAKTKKVRKLYQKSQFSCVHKQNADFAFRTGCPPPSVGERALRSGVRAWPLPRSRQAHRCSVWGRDFAVTGVSSCGDSPVNGRNTRDRTPLGSGPSFSSWRQPSVP